MKKILCIMMVVALIATMLTVGVVSTGAAETATITIYGLDGTTKVQEFNVGDEFTVYTTLDVSSSVDGGRVGSVEGYQTYSADVLALQDEIGGRYGEIVDRENVFPVTAAATMANGATAGRIDYNASTPSMDNGFAFDKPYSKLIVTTYKVTAAGAGEIKNALVNLAAANEALTKIVYLGETQPGMTVAGGAYYEDPIPEIDHAEVTVYKLDGSSETLEFSIGDTFTVYTLLNIKGSIDSGMAAAVQASQKYTSSVLELNDAVDAEGKITDTAKVFPVLGSGTLSNTKTAGIIKYSASTPYIDDGFRFDTDDSQLITTTYKVKANGFATVRNSIVVLAAADEDATKIVFGGITQPGMSYSMNSTFTEPGTTPTQPPTRPTQAPTEAPTNQPTTAPTQPASEPSTLVVTIKGPNGSNVQKTVNVGESFTVYTMLDITGSVADGKAADIDGYQTYDTAALQLTDAVSGADNVIVNKTAMFPILGNDVVAAANNGTIKFNASKPDIGDGYVFNSDKSKLIVTNYKALKGGTATIETKIKTLVASDEDVTKIIYKETLQPGMSVNLYESYTDPGQAPTDAPTQAPTDAPTQAPTDAPTQAPTQAPTNPPANKAAITIIGFDGTSETKYYNVGDTFKVYTTLDVHKAIGDSQVGSISAVQEFPQDILTCTAQVDSYNVVRDKQAMFPILGDAALAKVANGTISYNASTPYIGEGFEFSDEDSILIVSEYRVTANGVGTINNTISTLAAADENLTKIIYKGVNLGYEIGGYASYTEPGTEPPTEAPTEAPTDAPTEAPTQAPTDAPVGKATITVVGIDGTTETQTYNVGDTFTVYTTLDAHKAIASSQIASISAKQTYPQDILTCTAQVDGSGVVRNTTAMFPILKSAALARITDGTISYNASTPYIGEGFDFKDEASLLIVSTYRVTNPGTGTIANSIYTLAAADENLTRIIDKGVNQGYEVGGIASYTEPQAGGETYLLGDTDGNEEVESIDATYILRTQAEMNVPIDAQTLLNGDVDRSGELEVVDATYIQRWLAEFPVPYPIGEWVTRD